MNSYEKIYDMLTESTPAGREGSKDVGRKFGAQIALAKPGPYGTPSRMGLKGKPAEDLTATLTKKAKKEGGQAVRTGKLKVRLQRRKDQPHRDYERAVKAGVAGIKNRANFEPGPKYTYKDI
tara:strand:+ start:671 stop:1036 length:366 start_codon:yes stop_codon:yes gene_type:complete